MKKLVIIPGGFHPFHAGHKALYDAARDAFPSADVYVAATADTATRPFPFEVKQKLARMAGIDGHRFIQVKSPFQAREITQHYDPNDTVLIFARSEKDRETQPQAGAVKKDGTSGYLQPYKRNGLEPMSKHGYMVYLPTVQFGPGMTSATEIRAKWPDLESDQKLRLVNQLYPDTQQKTKLAGVIVQMLDAVMSPVEDKTQPKEPEVKEAIVINDPELGMRIRPAGGQGTWREEDLVRDLAAKFGDALTMLKTKNYQGLYHMMYRAGLLQNRVKSLAELQAFQIRQGRRPIARGAEIDITDYVEEKRASE